MLRLIFACWLAATPLYAAGQMIYKVQMPDGSVLYTDSVPAGGKVLEERESKSTPRVNTLPSQPAGKAAPPTTARPGVPAAAMVRPPPRPDDAAATTLSPERELTAARRKLELGREPLPGERRGLAGGGSRLTPEYEARIATLEREVAAAEAKVKQASNAGR